MTDSGRDRLQNVIEKLHHYRSARIADIQDGADIWDIITELTCIKEEE